MSSSESKYRCLKECAEGVPWNAFEKLEWDPASLEGTFRYDLAFGAGGLRGIVEVGSYRMNVHAVAKVAQGLADCLNTRFGTPSMAIARNS